MNKTDLVKEVAKRVESTQGNAEKAVDAVFSAIQETLATGENVQIIGFGTFEVKERAERTGRNPQTGAEITISASKNPTFKAGKSLKEAVNQ